MPKYSIIVPVFNRPNEVKELLISLSLQKFKDYELVLVEDGSDQTCYHLVQEFEANVVIRYFFKTNTGPGDSRNHGITKAKGDYFLFFDSDCILPADYLEKVHAYLSRTYLDAFGGPDNAHESFSDTQKAINYAMTSFFTTGGIRGGKKQLDKFQPRSFNMGLSREVHQEVGGFSNIHPGEDPDLSYRIMDAGFRVGLIRDAFVYHKRRIDFTKYLHQVYKFGVVRVVLNKWHPTKKNLVFYLPTLFLLGSIVLVLGAIFLAVWFLIPLGLFAGIILIDSLRTTKSPIIASKAVLASFIQLYGYGYGFMKSFLLLCLLRRDERKSLSSFFFLKEK